MRQVPEHSPYLIVGNGRMAKHLCYYFDSLSIDYHHWYRSNDQKISLRELKDKVSCSDKVLLAISDDQILPFFEKMVRRGMLGPEQKAIHFSGQITDSRVVGFHPLCTFAGDMYDKNFYRKIPFVGDQTENKFRDIFPELPNPNFHLDAELKPLYHAYCSMAANFSQILWAKLFYEFENKLDLPREIVAPFIQKTFENLQRDGGKAITGPLVRKDDQTIKSHLEHLSQDQTLEIYKAFSEYAQQGELYEINQ